MTFPKLLLACFVLTLAACSEKNSNQHSSPLFLGESNHFHGIDSNQKVSTKESPVDVRAIYFQVAAGLSTSMLECPARIWPSYEWKKMNILLLQKGAPSLVWKGSTGQIENLAEDQVPAGARQGLYSFFSWNGEDAVAIYSDGSLNDGFFSSAQSIFKLVIHEGFHYLGQRDWASRKGNRGTAYPINAVPREYRRMILDNIRIYFVSKGSDDTSLGRASYWFHKWQDEFPEEASASTDGYEGTARYVDLMGLSLNEAGCVSSDDVLLDKLSNLILNPDLPEFLGHSVSGEQLELDSEGYDIGSLAAFVLRFIQKNPTWYDEVKNGKTPLEILLKGVAPIADTIPAEIETKFRQTQNSANAILAPWINDEISHEKDPLYVRVVFSTQAAQGSYSPKGFYLPKALPGVTFIPLAMPYEFKFKSWSMTAEVDKVLRSMPDVNPCNGGSFVALVAKTDISMQDGKIKIARTDIHGEMPGTEKIDAGGFTWFCGE